MKALLAMLVVGFAALSACSASLPVVGQMQRSDETFRGTVTGSGYSGGSGELTIVSNRNATCKGNFTYTSRRRGEGVLKCDDGRTGPFHLVSAGTSGSGYGDLGGYRYTLTFGSP